MNSLHNHGFLLLGEEGRPVGEIYEHNVANQTDYASDHPLQDEDPTPLCRQLINRQQKNSPRQRLQPIVLTPLMPRRPCIMLIP